MMMTTDQICRWTHQKKNNTSREDDDDFSKRRRRRIDCFIIFPATVRYVPTTKRPLLSCQFTSFCFCLCIKHTNWMFFCSLAKKVIMYAQVNFWVFGCFIKIMKQKSSKIYYGNGNQLFIDWRQKNCFAFGNLFRQSSGSYTHHHRQPREQLMFQLKQQ